MFDKFKESIEDAINNTLNTDKVMITEQSNMQDYKFDDKRPPSAVYIRWCLTYLNRDE